MRLPCRETPPEIGLDACGGLIAILGGLGEQLQDYGLDRIRDSAHPLARRCRSPGNVAVDPFHGIGGRERKRSGEHLVKRDAERIEIAAGVDRSVHAASLLGRHVGKRAGDDFRRRGRLALARQPRRNAEAGEADVAGGVDERIRRLDVLVDEAMPVDLAERCRQADGEAQEARQVERSAEGAIEGLAAIVLKDKRRTPSMASKRQRPDRPLRIKVDRERIFIFEPLEAPQFRSPCDERQHRDRITRLPGPVQRKLAVVAQKLQLVSREVHDKAIVPRLPLQ